MKSGLLRKLSNGEAVFCQPDRGNQIHEPVGPACVFERYNSKSASIFLFPKNCILIPNQNESVTPEIQA